MSITKNDDGQTSGYATFGQRARAYVSKGWQRGSGWSASLGDITGSGKTQTAAMDELAERVVKVCQTAYDKGYLVQHDDGSLTVCQWFGDVVTQTRVRDGRVTVTSSGGWESPKEAAEDATREECAGPGAIVRL